jgi:Na+(H+)/acetate symporter ActP
LSIGTAGDAASVTTVQLVQQLVSSVMNLFTMTFFPCVLLSVYYDLKLRREGSDLAGRVGALNPTA